MSSKFDDARLDEIMEQYKQQLLQFQRARRDSGNVLQYEQQVTLAPVDYRKMSDEEIFSQPAIPLAEDVEMVQNTVQEVQTALQEAQTAAQQIELEQESTQAEDIPLQILPPPIVEEVISEILADADPEIIEELVEEGMEEAGEAEAVNEGTAMSVTTQPSEQQPQPAATQIQTTPVIDNQVEFYDVLSQNTAPRMMFAKGCGAFGAFKPYQSFGDICAAPFLQSLSPLGVFVRFSSDVLPGDADARRCQRGLTMRIYDGKNHYDLIFSHLPLSLIANPDLMPKLMMTARPNSVGLRGNAPLWQFVLEHNEALQGVLWLNSDLGTAPSYRTISYYSMPLYFIDQNGQRRLCRMRLSPRATANPLTRFEAEELCGCDPDALTKDLNIALTQNEGVVFELSAQIIDDETLAELDFNPLDPTIPWRLSRFPIVTLGEVILNRQVTDHNSQVERFHIKFTTPPGMEHPVGSLYEAMSMSAPQAQYYRTGEENRTTPTLYTPDPWSRPQTFESPVERVGQWLDQMSQREKKRLIDNLGEELSVLDADLLEQVLLLLTSADLAFGKALTLALEGV